MSVWNASSSKMVVSTATLLYVNAYFLPIVKVQSRHLLFCSSDDKVNFNSQVWRKPGIEGFCFLHIPHVFQPRGLQSQTCHSSSLLSPVFPTEAHSLAFHSLHTRLRAGQASEPEQWCGQTHALPPPSWCCSEETRS